MVRKQTILGLIGLAIIALSLLALASAPAPAQAAAQRTYRFRVIGHTRSYDVIRRNHRTFVVYHRYRYVSVRGMLRYKVVKRSRTSVTLRRLATPRPLAAARAQATVLSGVPLSVGLPATASSAFSGAPAAAANDGRANTRWTASGSRSYPQWWTVDLGTATRVSGVRVSWYAPKRAYRYRIATSLDGLSFTTAEYPASNRVEGTTSDAFAAVARYVRVTVLGVKPSGVAASAYEITVNGEPVAAPNRPRAHAGADPIADRHPAPDPGTDADPDRDADADAYPNADGDTDTDADSDADPDAHTHADRDTDADTHADSDADPYAHTHADSDADPDADADSHADSDPDTYPTPTPTSSTADYVGRTFTTYTVPAGTHDVVYENCTFTGRPTSHERRAHHQPALLQHRLPQLHHRRRGR